MISFKKIFPLILMPILLYGCASLQQEYEKTTCNKSAAYGNGLADAYANKNLDRNYGSGCSGSSAELMEAYVNGYKDGINEKNKTIRAKKSGPAHDNGNININVGHHHHNHVKPYPIKGKYECITAFGNKACGYNCVKSIDSVRCASKPDQQCIADNFGNIACGYGCTKSFNNIKCATKYGQSCVADNFGHIACGYNCIRKDFGVACAKSPKQNCVIDSFGNGQCGHNCRIVNMSIQCD